ncbi:peptidoglycan DD-metalloendopeptidase family protein [Rhodanobacter sp. C03]|uniref:peptidoglycan DD-metalloendopeptidase family protein n=1 Tax=Rhodanobacter sp. C03 TaxID=1945858 RepID=UPI00098613DB|nr:peptidoglycan DD-metalloendopeptidase family protein [Rhodanobacter sp. C03]OOG56249.1 peptidase M23 [Rhodanobacter sp. C03]
MLMRMDRTLQWLMPFVVSLLLVGCGTMRSSVVVEPAPGSGYDRGSTTVMPARTPIPGGSYQVAKGDTLYSIAFRNGVDFRDLAQWNGIAVPYTIWPGQRLTLSPSSKPAIVHVTSTPSATPATPPPVVAAAPVFETVRSPPATSASIDTSAHPAPASPVQLPPLPKPGLPTHPAVASTTTVVPVAGLPTPAPATLPPPAPVPLVASGPSRGVSGVNWRWPAEGSLISRFKSGDAIPGIEIGGKQGDPVRAAADGVVVYSGNGLVGYGELVIIKHNDSFLSAYGHNSKRLVKEGQRVSAGQQIAEMGSTGATRNELEFQIRKDGNPVDPLGYLPSR